MGIHSHTPKLEVNDPRGLQIRNVDYWRDDENRPAQTRIHLTLHDASGRATQQWDPRLWSTVQANLVIVHSISNKVLSSVSVDGGWRVNLAGDGEQLLEQWDGRGTRRQTRYDQQMRPLEVFENEETAERLFYGDETSSDHNQCGRLIRHEDPAGVLLFNEYGLNGAVLDQDRGFVHESPGRYVTRSRLTPLGDMQIQTDAQANTQRFSHTRDGRLRGVELQLSNTVHWLPMVSAITYNAEGQVEKEMAGNGVVTALEFFAEDGRLKRLQSRRGQHEHLQDLRYAYDSVGNVLCIEDAALPIRYFANQRIEPINRYRYDSLSQLIEATGWEAGTVKYGALSEPSKILANFRQTYRYDEANNLLELSHFGACNPGHRLVAASHSNRCLPVIDDMEPGEDDFREGFDANGNLLKLQRGVSLVWNRRNQLDQVRPVERGAGTDDSEHYLYGADGMRVRKIRVLQTSAQANIIETVYLPGLEIRTHSGSGEELHVIDIRTGRGSVRVLHWEAGRPSSIANNQQRYSLTDHLGSGSLELDQDANIITRENYYPFGGTAWSDGEAVQVSYKTHRYSGKERDATGLYYYGFRYYLAEWQRWLSPDPVGAVDGLAMYSMVGNNPLGYTDRDGLARLPIKLGIMPGDVSLEELEIEVNTFNLFYFKTQLPKKKVGVLDVQAGLYKPLDDFVVVEVGVGSREDQRRRIEMGVMDTEEVKSTLESYRQQYANLRKSSVMAQTKDSKLNWNFKAGEYISERMLVALTQSERGREEDRAIKKKPDTRLFALVKKDDQYKEPAERKIHGITMMSLEFPSENNDAQLSVDFTLIDPGSQLSGEQLRLVEGRFGVAQDTRSLKGAGTYLTMNALHQVSETVNLKTISTQAMNPRSLAIVLGWGNARPL